MLQAKVAKLGDVVLRIFTVCASALRFKGKARYGCSKKKQRRNDKYCTSRLHHCMTDGSYISGHIHGRVATGRDGMVPEDAWDVGALRTRGQVKGYLSCVFG